MPPAGGRARAECVDGCVLDKLGRFHFLAFTQACAKEPPERTSRFKDFAALPAALWQFAFSGQNNGWEHI
jgi:hypothetical protein